MKQGPNALHGDERSRGCYMYTCTAYHNLITSTVAYHNLIMGRRCGNERNFCVLEVRDDSDDAGHAGEVDNEQKDGNRVPDDVSCVFEGGRLVVSNEFPVLIE